MSQLDDELDFVADESDFALRTYLETLLDRGVLNDRTLTIAAKLRAVLLSLHECARPRETHPVRKGYQSLCNDFRVIWSVTEVRERSAKTCEGLRAGVCAVTWCRSKILRLGKGKQGC